jgi:hypothetical protein
VSRPERDLQVPRDAGLRVEAVVTRLGGMLESPRKSGSSVVVVVVPWKFEVTTFPSM